MERPLILLSGGFDPYHDGHAEMFHAAAQIGDICVILNSDEWLVKKKGKFFMNEKERSYILMTVKGVKYIHVSESLDTVCDDIRQIKTGRPNSLIIFGKGGDRNATNTPEQDTCQELGVPVIFGLGGNNEQSSSKILERYQNTFNNK